MNTAPKKEVAFAAVLNAAISRGDHHTCLNCMHWSIPRDICIKFNAKPPAKVIVFSCGKDWEDDIPF